MNTLVLVNGDLYRSGILRKRVQAEKFDLVLAADAGARHARTLSLKLDAIVGDMDSISNQEQDFPRVHTFIHPAEKNETDLELALLHARENGAERIVVVGVMGGRMDMAIANVMLLAHPCLDSCRIEAWHGNQTAWLIRPPGQEIPGRPGDTISLIPIGGDAVGVTTKGLQYRLKREKLYFGAARGLSNKLKTAHVHVSLASGNLLAVLTPARSRHSKPP